MPHVKNGSSLHILSSSQNEGWDTPNGVVSVGFPIETTPRGVPPQRNICMDLSNVKLEVQVRPLQHAVEAKDCETAVPMLDLALRAKHVMRA